MADLIGQLFNRNESKLPLLVQQQHQQQQPAFESSYNSNSIDCVGVGNEAANKQLSEKEQEEYDRYLDEFILSCLIDPTFAKFVQNVDERLASLVRKELN